MAWARLDDRLHQNPKLARISADAFRLWVHSITFSCLNRTDGVILRTDLALTSPGLSANLRASKARELVKNGLWIETTSGWEIHDFLEFNPSADEIQETAVMKGKAGSKGNHVRWHVKRGGYDPDCKWCRTSDRRCDPTSEASATRKLIADDRSRARPRPDPSPPVPETEKLIPPSNGSQETAARTALELWERHKQRPLRIDETQTIRACLKRFGDERTADAVRAAIAEGAEYASRIELHAAKKPSAVTHQTETNHDLDEIDRLIEEANRE